MNTALVKCLQDASEVSEPLQSHEQFVSRNITVEEYEALPRAEKRRYDDETEKLNQHWVDNQLKDLQGKWIMIIDGQVVLHGTTLDSNRSTGFAKSDGGYETSSQ